MGERSGIETVWLIRIRLREVITRIGGLAMDFLVLPATAQWRRSTWLSPPGGNRKSVTVLSQRRTTISARDRHVIRTLGVCLDLI